LYVVVITQFWVIPQNKFLFFFKKIINKNIKNKKDKKIIKAGNVEKVCRKIKLQFLKEIQDLLAPHCAQNWRKKMQIQGQIK
jgi:Zn finger protein HypA/HybF involved in hydrogenase expression